MIDLYPHQEKALHELSAGNILVGGVGSGKTRTALAFYDKEYSDRQLVIITTAKKRDSKDWEKEIDDVGLVIETDVIVDSWNNIQKYKRYENSFFIFDEQRLSGKGAWVKAFLHLANRNPWILLSATPGDNWTDYMPVFVANRFYKHKTDFYEKHVIYDSWAKFPKIVGYRAPGLLDNHKRAITVEMPYQRHTVRNEIQVIIDHKASLLSDVRFNRWNFEKQEPIKSVAELFYLMRKVVNYDPDRLLAIEKIFVGHKRLIIFYNFDYELEMLRELKNILDVPVAEWNGHKHQAIPKTESWLYLVQYTSGAEGWNCTITDTIVFYSLNYSYRVLEQSKGRIDRLNTPFTDLYYYMLHSDSWIDNKILEALKKKKSFNEGDYYGKEG